MGLLSLGYVLHHKDITLKYRDPERYAEWRTEDLEMITRSEHNKIHMTGNRYAKGHKHSIESRKKISERKKELFNEEKRQHYRDANLGEKNPMFGKHLTKEQIEKMRIAFKKAVQTPEFKQKQSALHKGCHWWNNGVEQRYQKECPGEGWINGRILSDEARKNIAMNFTRNSSTNGRPTK